MPDFRLPVVALLAATLCPLALDAQATRPSAPGRVTAQTAPFLLDAPATVAAPQRKSTAHLELETWPVADSTHPGGVQLVVKVRPRPGMRLYAPGEKNYVGVAVVLDAAQPARLGPATLPAPSTYVFPPTGESNRVFTAPFTLQVPVRFEPRPRSRPDRLTGRFEYQACDDTLCYKPVRLPLSWKLGG